MSQIPVRDSRRTVDPAHRIRPMPSRLASPRLAAAAACGLLASMGSARAAVVPAGAPRIVEVTVFADRAEVLREARVDLPAGASTVEFTGLPWSVEADSLRASAKGVPAALGAVEIRERADEPKETPELIAARDEVRRLEAEIAVLDADEATGKDLREFLKALKATTAARESEKMGEGRADPASLQAVYALIKGSLLDLSHESLARVDRRAKLQKDLEVARARLAAARPTGAIRTKTATVEVEAKQAGALTIRLGYLAPGAAWRPAYRASLDAATGEIALASEAVVRQSTGEDWSGVSLKLSTAAPARGVEPPRMSSILLRPVEVIAQRARVGALGGFAKAAPAPPPADEMSAQGVMAPMEVAHGTVPDTESETREAGVVHSAYNVAFEVPGRSDVPADGREHRVGLRQEALTGKVAYRAVPALNAAAFLVARTQAPAGYPLLAGPVRVFAGGAYLGSFPVEETGPGAEVTLPFGIDNRIAVERTPLPQARGRSGIFGKEKRIGYAFLTTVENLRDQKVSLILEDRIPVSEDERIEVEMGEGTTPGWTEVKDRPGILEWALDLEPRGKREFVLEYTVRFPRELYVPGVE